MLSIGKLAAGQADYYLEQAHGRGSGAVGVASGVEDYYLGGGEAPGLWIGAGATRLGLRGRVGEAELRAVLASVDPRSGVELRRWGRVPGFDVTFSAPKSVSVLFGIGDDRLRKAIRDAHDGAVREAFGYLEREAALARRGSASRGTLKVLAGEGLVGAAFRHRTSRAGDPQLHTHVLVANLVQGPDGRWSALDARALYAHAKTAGFLYEAALRAQLTRELGVEWTPVRNGMAEIVGVPAAVLRAFSRRRVEIEAALERLVPLPGRHPLRPPRRLLGGVERGTRRERAAVPDGEGQPGRVDAAAARGRNGAAGRCAHVPAVRLRMAVPHPADTRRSRRQDRARSRVAPVGRDGQARPRGRRPHRRGARRGPRRRPAGRAAGDRARA